MKAAIIPAFVLMLLVSSGASAWQWETHSTLAEKVCRDFGCGCIAEIRDAAVIPDRDFKDTVNHHCYNVSEPCAPSEYYTCPKKNSCPALEKMEKWLSESRGKTACERWKSIGIASHYYFDSRVFWHKVQSEDYDKCHEPFEGDVEKKFEANDGSGWTIDACGASENYANMVQYAGEFEEILADNSAPPKIQDAPLLPECGWWCRFWDWLSAIF